MYERLYFIGAFLMVLTVVYWIWARREGRVKQVVDVPGALSSELLGDKRGYRATFVQFSTPMCAKCPPTKALLKTVAGETKDVAYIEIDAERRLDLARELGVMRTPTTLILNHEGLVVARISGATTEAQARLALESAPPVSTDYII